LPNKPLEPSDSGRPVAVAPSFAVLSVSVFTWLRPVASSRMRLEDPARFTMPP
jgi:hypothetical protein